MLSPTENVQNHSQVLCDSLNSRFSIFCRKSPPICLHILICSCYWLISGRQGFILHLPDHWHVLLTEIQQALEPSSVLFYCSCQLIPFAVQNIDMKTGRVWVKYISQPVLTLWIGLLLEKLHECNTWIGRECINFITQLSWGNKDLSPPSFWMG